MLFGSKQTNENFSELYVWLQKPHSLVQWSASSCKLFEFRPDVEWFVQNRASKERLDTLKK